MAAGSPIGASHTTSWQDPVAQGPDEDAALSSQIVRLYQQGKFDEAIPLAKQVLAIREKALGANHPRCADALNNLGLLYLAAKKFAEAEMFFKRSMAIYEKNRGPLDLLLAKTLQNLGFLRNASQDVPKAEEYYRRAVAILEKSLGPDHAETIAALTKLAEFYMIRGRYASAEPLLKKLIAGKEKQPDAPEKEVAGLLESLGCAMYMNKEVAEGTKIEERANHTLYGEAAKTPQPIRLPPPIFACRVVKLPPIDFSGVAGSTFDGATKLVVEIETDETGKVISARMISGNQLFKKASEKAAMAATLRPTIVDGKPVRVKGIIVNEFSIETTIELVPGTAIRP